ncbi:FHA domain-containing protein [Oligoflexia bacterium]|nr:FHA domain-containing protein [Oligoflexia bacterium]
MVDQDRKTGRPRKNTQILTRQQAFEQLGHRQFSFLEILSTEAEHKTIKLETAEIVIGRGEECTLCLPFDSISHTHCRIFSHNNEYYLEDLGSTNGTLLNHVKIEKSILRKNDQLDIGEVRIVYREEDILDHD